MDNTTGALMKQAFLTLLENTISYTVSYRGDTGIYGVTEKISTQNFSGTPYIPVSLL